MRDHQHLRSPDSARCDVTGATAASSWVSGHLTVCEAVCVGVAASTAIASAAISCRTGLISAVAPELRDDGICAVTTVGSVSQTGESVVDVRLVPAGDVDLSRGPARVGVAAPAGGTLVDVADQCLADVSFTSARGSCLNPRRFRQRDEHTEETYGN